MTSNEKAASPKDAILPDWDGLSEAGIPLARISRSETGVAQEAAVEHTTSSVARLRPVRNRIESPLFSFDFLADMRARRTTRAKERHAPRIPAKAFKISFLH